MKNTITLYKQIHPCQCSQLAKMGFKSIINLRFDDEITGQPKSDELNIATKQAGLSYHHLPVDGENLHSDTVKAFATLLKSTPQPIMVFCGTGSRAKRIYQSAVVSGLI